MVRMIGTDLLTFVSGVADIELLRMGDLSKWGLGQL